MKKALSIMILFAAFFLVSACGTSNGADDNNNVASNEELGEDNDATEDVDEKAIINDLGIYVGQADPHTVEIETNEGPKAFQLTDESKVQIEQLESNDEVKFNYFVNEKKQNILQSIEKMNDALDDENKDTGIYNGQQDPHTIEIETADGPTAFQLTMEAREQVEPLQVGKKVTYTYEEKGEQLIIDTIKQIE